MSEQTLLTPQALLEGSKTEDENKKLSRPTRPPPLTPDVQKKIDKIRKEEITKINKVLKSKSSFFTRSSKK